LPIEVVTAAKAGRAVTNVLLEARSAKRLHVGALIVCEARTAVEIVRDAIVEVYENSVVIVNEIFWTA
jgi:hypothetical protein